MNESLFPSDDECIMRKGVVKERAFLERGKGYTIFFSPFSIFHGMRLPLRILTIIDSLKYKIERKKTISYLHVDEVISGGNIDSAAQTHSSCDSFPCHIKLDL